MEKVLTEFPIYRKYSDYKRFFKIDSYEHFSELSIMGNYYELRDFHAQILPDRNFIMDMIKNEGGYWLASSSEEYHQWVSYCQMNLEELQ